MSAQPLPPGGVSPAPGATLTVDAELGAPGLPHPRFAGSFSVAPGVTALVGPSGAGKSSALALIAGVARPDRGRITLGDACFVDTTLGRFLPPERRGVGVVFQGLALFPHLTVRENVEFGLPRALPRAERRRVAGAWLERLSAGPLAERWPASLSGGEAQRVALARALAGAPRVLLLDEPFTALDAPLRAALREQLAALLPTLGIPVVLVSHDADDLGALSARRVELHAGRATPSAVAADPG